MFGKMTTLATGKGNQRKKVMNIRTKSDLQMEVFITIYPAGFTKYQKKLNIFGYIKCWGKGVIFEGLNVIPLKISRLDKEGPVPLFERNCIVICKFTSHSL
jgi:hypothetical protein